MPVSDFSIALSNLKVSFRNITKSIGFTAINIGGLAISLSVCLVIILYIKDQKSIDKFHVKRDRIVQVYTNLTDSVSSEVYCHASTPAPLAQTLFGRYPFIEDIVRIREESGNIILNNEAISAGILYTEPSFFNIFSFPLKSGSAQSALDKPYSVVISEEMAARLFGKSDPLNQTVEIDNLGTFSITGVIKEVKERSHIRFDILVSFSTITSLEMNGMLEKSLNIPTNIMHYYTYVLLNSTSDAKLLDQELPKVAKLIIPESKQMYIRFGMQLLSNMNPGIKQYNRLSGAINFQEVVYLPYLVVVLVLLACFNYIILSIAHSLKRSKESIMRKIMGASRSQIARLFLSETFLLVFFALFIACLLLLWLIPEFNGLDTIEKASKQISTNQLREPGTYLVFLIFFLIVSFLAGLYPSLYLSSLTKERLVPGTVKYNKVHRFITRKLLLSFQFAISLISVVFIIYFSQLINFWVKFDYGITNDNMVNVSIEDIDYEVFKYELGKNTNITGISFSNDIPIYGGMYWEKLMTENSDIEKDAYYYSVDIEFISNFGIKLQAGRNFSQQMSTDKTNSMIINETGVKTFGFETPEAAVGRTLHTKDGKQLRIIGVTKDFGYTFPDVPIQPMFLVYQPELFRFANLQYVSGKKDEIKTYLAETWKKFDKIQRVESYFIDDSKEDTMAELRDPIYLASWICGFIVVIATLGLLGMAGYTSEVRIKEIGIRKVFGISNLGAIYLLAKDYLKLMIITACVAIPVAFFLTKTIFQDFENRPEMNLWVLPVVLFFFLLLSVITIGSQTIKAVMANPADTLRFE
jgi:putative ABC transport system permease protein